jgi:hypothetical protein
MLQAYAKHFAVMNGELLQETSIPCVVHHRENSMDSTCWVCYYMRLYMRTRSGSVETKAIMSTECKETRVSRLVMSKGNVSPCSVN